jgi:hypothetical protein
MADQPAQPPRNTTRDVPFKDLIFSLKEYDRFSRIIPPSLEAIRIDNNPWLRRLCSSGQYSDFVISCGTDEYKVHRAIICTQSEFFASACAGFEVSSRPRTDSGSIILTPPV